MALDADSLVKWNQTSQLLRQGVNLVITPNVGRELVESVGIKNIDDFLARKGVSIVDSPVGASVPATTLRQQLDQIRLHRGNAGDALNFSEAGGIGADLFITGDKKAVNSLLGGSGTLTLPNSGGATIFLRALE